MRFRRAGAIVAWRLGAIGGVFMAVYLKLFAAALVIAIPATAASAGDLVYTPINPSFGGNPGNSSHLLSIASAQKDATASDSTANSLGGGGTSATGTSTSQTDAQLFVSQLEGRLLSALASQVTDAIFGTNPQDHGTVQFGDTTVVFDRSLSAINLTITDYTTGEVTQISVPQLVTSP
jgi:curli production assembly/transport component CsgF